MAADLGLAAVYVGSVHRGPVHLSRERKKKYICGNFVLTFSTHALLFPPSTASQREQVSGAIELHYLLADKNEVSM